MLNLFDYHECDEIRTAVLEATIEACDDEIQFSRVGFSVKGIWN